jgi:murein DD-endopeptidase MepM/ murein hydrolase activator NlpD
MFSKMTTLFEDCSKRPSGIKGTLELGVKLNTPIPSVSDGIVTKSKREPFCWGWSIEIDHGTNSRKNITTLYCHMFSHKVFVNVGDKVEKGQIIAEVGTNGACIKPSLHLEVRTIESRD